MAAALLSGCGSHADPARYGRLSADIQTLCAQRGLGWDLSGAPYDSAVACAARILEDAGLAPGVKDSAGTPRFVQPVPLVRNLVGDNSTMELTIGSKVKRLPEGRRTFLLLAPGTAGCVMQSLPPVFVGHGLHAPEYGVDDFAGLDLSGRAVLLTANPPDSATLARYPKPVQDLYADPVEAEGQRMRDIIERGAAAILLLPDRWLPDACDAVSLLGGHPVHQPTKPYPGHVLRSSIPVALLHPDLVDWLFLGRAYHPISHAGRYGTFELEGVTLRLDVDVRPEPLTTAHVVGLVQGSDRALRNEYVVVTAQLDPADRSDDGDPSSWDAAACATVLEVARVVRERPPKRSVIFVVFVGEEAGIWGSLHLLAHAPVPPEAIVTSIHIGSGEVPGHRSPSLQALASAPTLAGEMKDAARREDVDLRAASPETGPFRGTPSEVFIDAGIPSWLVIMGDERWARPSCSDPALADCMLHATRMLQSLVQQAGNAGRLGDTDPTR